MQNAATLVGPPHCPRSRWPEARAHCADRGARPDLRAPLSLDGAARTLPASTATRQNQAYPGLVRATLASAQLCGTRGRWVLDGRSLAVVVHHPRADTDTLTSRIAVLAHNQEPTPARANPMFHGQLSLWQSPCVRGVLLRVLSARCRPSDGAVVRQRRSPFRCWEEATLNRSSSHVATLADRRSSSSTSPSSARSSQVP